MHLSPPHGVVNALRGEQYPPIRTGNTPKVQLNVSNGRVKFREDKRVSEYDCSSRYGCDPLKGEVVMPTELVGIGGVLVVIAGAVVFALLRRQKAPVLPSLF